MSISAQKRKEVPLWQLSDGQRFALHLETSGRDIFGKVLYKTSGSVAVRLDAGQRAREFLTRDGDTVTLPAAAKTEHWALSTLVIPIPDQTKSRR